MSHFTRVNRVKLCHYRVDMVIELDLVKLGEAFKSPCKAAHLRWKRLGDQATKGLQRWHKLACAEAELEWGHVFDLYTGSKEIVKNFVGALLATVAAGVSGLAGGLFLGTSETDKALERNQQRIKSKVDSLEQRVNMDHKALSLLANLTAKLDHKVLRAMDVSDGADEVAGLILYQQAHFGPMLRALEGTITTHRFHSGLLRPSVIGDKIKELRTKVEPLGRELAITGELDLFKLHL